MGRTQRTRKKRDVAGSIEAIKPTTVLYKEVRRLAPILTTGRVLAIDPSCGSTSSMPAYALYEAGTLVTSEEILLPLEESLHHRLRHLAEELDKLPTADILIYEEIPAVRFHASGRTSAGSQASLLKAVGVVMACAWAKEAIGLRPSVWKRLVRPGYIKSDIADAIEMGYIGIALASHILATNPPRVRYGNKAITEKTTK